MRNLLAHIKLMPGYAETSTRIRPVAPDTIIVGKDECDKAVCRGAAIIDGNAGWLRFSVPGKRRYYFQYRPW